ncbi:YheC/YheD family protein [Cytobacillus suaedae]|nr:YheC/YheD family protein [Cytobacillus suaedae]
MFIKWIKDSLGDTLQLSQKMMDHYGITAKRVIVRFGLWSKEIQVKQNEALREDEIGLSQSLKTHVTIPEELSYELSISGRNIYIGPVIAFLISNKKRLLPKQLKKYIRRFANYNKINGLIYICSSSGINKATKTIDGYYYNPNPEKSGDHFTFGTFPYPGAMFNRKRLSSDWMDELNALMGDRVFNSYHFTKGELSEWMQSNENVKHYFPYTKELTSKEDVKLLLSQFSNLYIKPANGYGGKGIKVVSRTENGIMVEDDSSPEKKILKSNQELAMFIEGLPKKKYIIQQGISNSFDNKKVDFRVYMQKDQSEKWKCQGMIARMAREGKVTTNLKQVEVLKDGEEAIKELFNLSDSEVQHLINRIYYACSLTGQELDQLNGNYGDVAIDVIVDDSMSIWILEVNKTYGMMSFRILENPELYQRLLATPFEYAKVLAGF